jgi:hypothetical protein
MRMLALRLAELTHATETELSKMGFIPGQRGILVRALVADILDHSI